MPRHTLHELTVGATIVLGLASGIGIAEPMHSASSRRVYATPMNPREHPDDGRRHVKPPDWDAVGNRTRFTVLRGFGMENNRIVGYRIIKGGFGWRIPMLERVDRMDLTNMVIDVTAVNAYSKGGIPLSVQGVANVKVAGHEPLLNNAIERFLGKSRQEIIAIAKSTLEGSLRGILATMTPEQVNEDKILFAERLVLEVEQDMTALGLVVDTMEFGSKHVPQWNTISISGYHIREAGSTAAQELAFTLADGLEYVRWGIARGMDVDEFAPRLSFFFNAHNDFFEEIAKYRAARRIWAREMKETFKAKNPRSWLCRFHTQTAGVSLTAQQPENNVVRVAIQALAAVLGYCWRERYIRKNLQETLQ